MSGLECIGAILGIAGVGVQVSATLYDFAATSASAKDDMHMVAESIDTYSSVLETLGRQLEASQAVCSIEGIRLAQDLQCQSEVLFQKIAENIPSKSQNASMTQKMTWYFRKERVNFLLGQIEQLKATVSLLLQILILAQTSQPKTQQTTTTNTNTTTTTTTNNVNININVLNAEINSQFRRAENRVMQYHNASVKFARLQIEDEEPVVRNALPWREEFEELPVVRQRDNDDDIVASFGQLALRQPRMSTAETNANSSQLVNVLLDHWTTIETHTETETYSESFTTHEDESGMGLTNEPVSATSTAAEPSVGSSISRAETVQDNSFATRETTRTNSSNTAIDTTASTTTTTNNPIKGWWQRYRQSSKKTQEEEERSRALDTQERELQRRETQLQREQTLVERELRLQELEKEQGLAKAKALAEREVRLQESQRLKEVAAKQALEEKEIRAKEEQRQREARKEHVARLREIRKRPTAGIKNDSQKGRSIERVSTSGSVDLSNDTTSDKTSSDLTTTTSNSQSILPQVHKMLESTSRRSSPTVPTVNQLLSNNNNTNSSIRPSISTISSHRSDHSSRSHSQSQSGENLHSSVSPITLSSLLSSSGAASGIGIGNGNGMNKTPNGNEALERVSSTLREARKARKRRHKDRKTGKKSGESGPGLGGDEAESC